MYICHGVGEHCQRYDHVADPLTSKGLLVFSHDHGESISLAVQMYPVYFAFFLLLSCQESPCAADSTFTFGSSSLAPSYLPHVHSPHLITSSLIFPGFFSRAAASPAHFCPHHGHHPDVSQISIFTVWPSVQICPLSMGHPCQIIRFLAIFPRTSSDSFEIWHTCRTCLENNIRQIFFYLGQARSEIWACEKMEKWRFFRWNPNFKWL